MFATLRRSVTLQVRMAMGGLVVDATTAQGPGPRQVPRLERPPAHFRGQMDGVFSTIAPPLLTLDDSVSGHASGLGKTTGSFTVAVDFAHPVGDGFVLVNKEGSLVGADGDRVDLAMVGTFDVSTFDVHYVFVVTGGTGRFAGAIGNGTWDVPPPDVFDPVTGAGSGSSPWKA